MAEDSETKLLVCYSIKLMLKKIFLFNNKLNHVITLSNATNWIVSTIEDMLSDNLYKLNPVYWWG